MMNERIRKLAKESGLSISQAYSAEFNKFAELIVRECVSLFDGTAEMNTVGMLSHKQVVEQIKEHFGVEE